MDPRINDLIDADIHFLITDEDGEDIDCTVLFIYDCEQTGKHYLVYAENSDAEGNEQSAGADANVIAEEDIERFLAGERDGVDLEPVESDEEWDLIEAKLAEWQEEE